MLTVCAVYARACALVFAKALVRHWWSVRRWGSKMRDMIVTSIMGIRIQERIVSMFALQVVRVVVWVDVCMGVDLRVKNLVIPVAGRHANSAVRVRVVRYVRQMLTENRNVGHWHILVGDHLGDE